MPEEPPLFFYKETEPEGGFLSLWYKAPFKTGEITYQSAGHAILAAKARLFDDKVFIPTAHQSNNESNTYQEALERILAAENAEEQLTLGNNVKGFDESVWQEGVFQSVHCLAAAFSLFFFYSP